jgi:hypothetical protein
MFTAPTQQYLDDIITVLTTSALRQGLIEIKIQIFTAMLNSYMQFCTAVYTAIQFHAT